MNRLKGLQTTMRKIDVLLIDTPNIDIIVDDEGRFPAPGQDFRVKDIGLSMGGGAAISAMVLARLQMRPYMLCALGDDLFAGYIRSVLEKEGVGVEYKLSSARTGISIALDIRNDRRFLTYGGSISGITPSDVPKELLSKARHVHLTNYNGAEDYDEYARFIETAGSCGVTVSIDMCWDDTGRWDGCTLKLAEKVDVFFSNDMEICHYLDETDMNRVEELLSERGIRAVIKRGSRGASGIMDGQKLHVPAAPTRTVDTTGAGDAFNAGFLHAYLNGGNLRNCLQMGNICGALSVAGYGGCPDTLNLSAIHATAMADYVKMTNYCT